jgi:tRNA pseudouridine55 synthase
MTRIPREAIDGLLLLDKPVGLSSNDALVRVRRLFQAAKAGHGGTLDPLASGLLPVAFGEATKFVNDALNADKTYRAEVVFGQTRAGGDLEGEILESRPVAFDEAALRAALPAFTGDIDQLPPMHSALKREGRPLYEYAREGITVERSVRRVHIAALDLLSLERVPEVAEGEPGSLRAGLRVRCSKGTYIRTLAEDLGTALGCGAHLGGLRRESVGTLDTSAAFTLEALEAMTPAQRAACLRPCDDLVSDLPLVRLDEAHARRLLQGQRLRLDAPVRTDLSTAPDSLRVRAYFRDTLLGTATLDDGLLAPLRLLAGNALPS